MRSIIGSQLINAWMASLLRKSLIPCTFTSMFFADSHIDTPSLSHPTNTQDIELVLGEL